MYRNGLKSLREIADFWENLIAHGDSNNAEKSMRSSLRFWKEMHKGFNYGIKPKVNSLN